MSKNTATRERERERERETAALRADKLKRDESSEKSLNSSENSAKNSSKNSQQNSQNTLNSRRNSAKNSSKNLSQNSLNSNKNLRENSSLNLNTAKSAIPTLPQNFLKSQNKKLKSALIKAYLRLFKEFKRLYFGSNFKLKFYEIYDKIAQISPFNKANLTSDFTANLAKNSAKIYTRNSSKRLEKWRLKHGERKENFIKARANLKLARKSVKFLKEIAPQSEIWLKSPEFKAKYIDTNHPFPPLLNPANIDYEGISAEFAWELNLPLPPNYDLVYFNNGASASVHILNFFTLCGVRANPYWFDEKTKYIMDYETCIKHKNDFIVLPIFIDHTRKYCHLIDKDVPLFYVARDAISRIKSACNHADDLSANITPLMRKFNLSCKDFAKLFPQNKYWGAGLLPQIQIGFRRDILYPKICFDSFLKAMPNLSKIYCFAFEDFSPKNSFESFNKIAKLFKFNMPQDERLFNNRAEKARFGLGVLPVCLYAHEKDLNKKKFSLKSLDLKGGFEIFITADTNVRQGEIFELTKQILGRSYFINESEIIIYTHKNEGQNFLKNTALLKATKAFIKGYLKALEINVAKTMKALITEKQILAFLKKDAKNRRNLKKILDEELNYLKINEPKIIASWKYYKEFEEICAK